MYYNKGDEKRPNSTLNEDIQDWLTLQKIDYSPDMTKPELLILVRLVPVNKKYTVDKLFLNAGRTQ